MTVQQTVGSVFSVNLEKKNIKEIKFAQHFKVDQIDLPLTLFKAFNVNYL